MRVSRDPADVALALEQIRSSGLRRSTRAPFVITEHHERCLRQRARRMARRDDRTCVCPESWPIFLQLRDQCRLRKLPAPLPEFRFSTVRAWRFDAAWSLAPIRPIKLALEIDGGVFVKGGGRHNRGAGYRTDQEKFAEATILGWHVLRVLPEDVKSGKAICWVERFFAARGPSSFSSQPSSLGAARP